ncbi:MAG: tetratricopeptide repeat protein [bacterium]
MFIKKIIKLRLYHLVFGILMMISVILVFANESKINLFNKYIQNKDYTKAQEIINEIKKESLFDALIAQMILYAYKDNNLDNSKKVLKLLKSKFVDNISDENKKNLNFSKILYNWGYILYTVKKDIYQSEVTINDSLKYNSNNIDSIILLAKINYDKNNLENAEELLSKAYDLALNKKYSDLVNLVSIYTDILIENKRYSKAKNILENYYQKDTKLLLKYAKVLTYLDELVQANEIIKEYLKKDNNNLEAYYILGITYKKSYIKIPEALEFINSINSAKDDRYYIKLAQFYEGVNDIDMALNYYDKALSINKENRKYYILGITYAIDVGKSNRAINWAYELYNKYPEDFYSAYLLAVCYDEAKLFDKAKEFYYKAINIKNDTYEPYVRLSRIFLEEETDFDSSVKILIQGYYNINDLYYKNRFKKSIKDLLDLQKEFKQKYKEKTGLDISKPVKKETLKEIEKILYSN